MRCSISKAMNNPMVGDVVLDRAGEDTSFDDEVGKSKGIYKGVDGCCL